MQTIKFLLVICAVILLAAVSILRAAESEAQKKAREALRQKWMELEGQSPTARPPAPAPLKPPAAAPTPRAVAPATPPPAAPVAAPRRTESDAQTKAREALRQQYQVDQAQPPGAPGAPATGTAWPATAAWNPGAADNPAQAKAREALWQKWRELDAQQPVAPPIGTPSEPVMAFKPIEPPPSAFSGSKAGRLAELLRQYRADQITPEHYHKQRAAILAEK